MFWGLGFRVLFMCFRLFLFRLPTARIPYSDEPEAGFRAQLRVYSKPHKVGNRIKAKKCWDSLYISLKD